MVEQYFQGAVPKSNEHRELDNSVIQEAVEIPEKIDRLMEKLDFSLALESIWQFINRLNKYIEESQPWRLKKENSPALGTLIYNLIESLRIISLLVSPFMPGKAKEMWAQIGMEDMEKKKIEDLNWGLTIPGTSVRKGNPLFPRI